MNNLFLFSLLLLVFQCNKDGAGLVSGAAFSQSQHGLFE
jgi:hypothetical protein